MALYERALQLIPGGTQLLSKRPEMFNVMGTAAKVPDIAQQWAMSEYMNNKLDHTGKFSVGIMLSFLGTKGVTFAEFTSIVVDHELAHGFGLNEGYIGPPPEDGGTAKLVSGKAYPYDIMGYVDDKNDNLTFKTPLDNQLRAAVGLTPNIDNVLKDAVETWRDAFNLLNGINLRDGIKQEYAPAATGPARQSARTGTAMNIDARMQETFRTLEQGDKCTG